MTDYVSAGEFHAAEGVEDWRVIGDGACVYYRTESFAASARLVQATAELPGVEGHRPDVDVRRDGVTVRLLTTSSAYYGMSRRDIELARRVEGPFEIALQIHPADQKDLEALLANGWRIVDPRTVADTPDAFRSYVQGSGAEFSVAQGIYVDTNSGWFSDRTVRYLASGRPALVQDTGFGRHLPAGEGLVSFRSLEEAIEGAARIREDYRSHAQAARRIAEQYFSIEGVIARLLKDIGCGE